MQPFSVTCETCGARLKVRDASLDGQIHSCPKCASMVLIAVPTELLDKETPGAIDPSSETAPIEQPAAAAQDFGSDIDGLLDGNPGQPAAADTGSEPDNGPVSEPQPTAEAVGIAAPAASNTSLLVWSVAGVVAVCTMGILGAMLWNAGADDEVADNQAASTITGSEDQLTLPTNADVESSPAVTDDSEPAKTEAKTLPDETLEVPLLPPAADDATPPDNIDLPPMAEAKPEAADPIAAVDEPKQPEQPAVDDHADEPEQVTDLPPAMIDPLGIDPMNLDLLLVPDDQQPVAEPTPAIEPAPVADADPTTDPTDQLPDKRTKRRFEPGSSSLGPSFDEQLPLDDLETRLAMRIPSVGWNRVPLDRALAEISQLSGVPITISPEALRMAPVAPDYMVSLSVKDIAVEEIFSGLASKVRLEVVRSGRGLALAKPDSDVRRKVTYRVDDLLTGDTRPLAELLQKLHVVDSTARVDPIIGSFEVEQPAGAQYDTLVFLERYRKALSKNARSKYPLSLIHSKPLLGSLSERLSRTTTFAFVDWTPLADVFDYWQDTSGVTMLVDWKGLSEEDLHPMSTLAGSVEQQPWGNALDACLQPAGLAWVPVDPQTIQITTLANAKSSAWIEFYDPTTLASLDESHRHADGLREALAERCDPDQVAQAVITSGVDDKVIVVRAGRNVHATILELAKKK